MTLTSTRKLDQHPGHPHLNSEELGKANRPGGVAALLLAILVWKGAATQTNVRARPPFEAAACLWLILPSLGHKGSTLT